MEEPVAPRSPDPNEEIDRLRDQLRRLEARHAETRQKLFDHYEWTREQTKAFAKELRAVRNISLEYRVLDFLHGLLQRTTGLPRKTLQEEVEPLEVSLVALPDRNDPYANDWFTSLLRQTHANLELIIVVGKSAPAIPQDIKDLANVREVRVDDNYSDAIRADIGLSYASGEIRGFVRSGYWPYERTIENVARFFGEYRTCHVMAPLDFSIANDLIVPSDEPGKRNFTQLWKTNYTRLGSLFFRPKAYDKLGRIVSDTSEAWIYATMLYLSTFYQVGIPSALVFVNASPEGSEPVAEANKESAYRELKNRFYLRSPFRNFEKAVWYVPISPSTPKGQSLRKLVEQALLCVRCFVWWPALSGFLKLQKIVFPTLVPLSFPVRPAERRGETTKVELYPVEPCPLAERCPDRFLFSLLPEGSPRIADVFYASESALAIVNRSRLVEDSSRKQINDEWVGGIPFIPPISSGSSPPAKTEKSATIAAGSEFAIAYDGAVGSLLQGMGIESTVWIGDRRFGPPNGGGARHEQVRNWDEVPALPNADLMALRELDLLSGRNPEMGTGLDLVHLAGVLQFCQRPRHLLRFLAMSLRYSGSILISTPNLDSGSLARLGPAWPYWEPERTHFIYGVRSLRALMKHCGFEERRLISFSHSSGQPTATTLDGEFLVGLFARKL